MAILRRLALMTFALLGLMAVMPMASSVTGASNVLISAAYADDDDDDDGVRRAERASSRQRPEGRKVQHGRTYRDHDDDDRARRKWRRSRDDDDDDDDRGDD